MIPYEYGQTHQDKYMYIMSDKEEPYRTERAQRGTMDGAKSAISWQTPPARNTPSDNNHLIPQPVFMLSRSRRCKTALPKYSPVIANGIERDPP